jgi:hypothetical protein
VQIEPEEKFFAERDLSPRKIDPGAEITLRSEWQMIERSGGRQGAAWGCVDDDWLSAAVPDASIWSKPFFIPGAKGPLGDSFK